MIHGLVRHAVDIFQNVCGDGWNNVWSLTAQCATGVQPQPAPESNQTDLAQVMQLQPDTTHTPTISYIYIYFFFKRQNNVINPQNVYVFTYAYVCIQLLG